MFNFDYLSNSNLEYCIEMAIENESNIEKCLFEDDEILNSEIYNIEIKKSKFSHCILSNCKFENTFFNNVYFENCDFSNSSFDSCNFTKVTFYNCKFIGCNLFSSILDTATFNSCNCEYLNFSDSSMRMSTSFNNIKLLLNDFNDCKFTSATFYKTSLADIDFTTSDISGISVDLPSLKGAIVNEFQAMSLSLLLGIKIK